MTVRSVEIGIVSADREIVEFLVNVFELEEMEPHHSPVGTVYKLRTSGTILKVLVPTITPKSPQKPESFIAEVGLRYLTLRVSDLDVAVTRAIKGGGSVVSGPFELGNGERMIILADPDGNALEILDAARSTAAGTS
jgi:hypothetical protein